MFKLLPIFKLLLIINQLTMKNFLFLFLLISSVGFSQELEWDKSKSFNVVFDIDNVYTSDGVNWEVTISGQAGPYGMGYGTITFKNFATDSQQSNYNGYFWTQVGDKTFRGTTNGLWKKEGNTYKTYAYDNDIVGGIINLAIGKWDFVTKKASFTVAPLK
jgi:hypothetical protein